MNLDDQRGLESAYRRRYRLLHDARHTPGTTSYVLARLAVYLKIVRDDYLLLGGKVKALDRIEEQVQREWRLHLTEQGDVHAWLAADEPDYYGGETPAYGVDSIEEGA